MNSNRRVTEELGAAAPSAFRDDGSLRSFADQVTSYEMDELSAESRIIKQWETLLAEAKKTEEYDPRLTYGVFQIASEIDTMYKDENDETVWNNLEVHSALQTLRALVKDYYNSAIVPTLFEYEFLK